MTDGLPSRQLRPRRRRSSAPSLLPPRPPRPRPRLPVRPCPLGPHPLTLDPDSLLAPLRRSTSRLGPLVLVRRARRGAVHLDHRRLDRRARRPDALVRRAQARRCRTGNLVGAHVRRQAARLERARRALARPRRARGADDGHHPGRRHVDGAARTDAVAPARQDARRDCQRVERRARRARARLWRGGGRGEGVGPGAAREWRAGASALPPSLSR